MIKIILIDNVSKRYGNKSILDSINLEIHPDELTFIVGSSGAGKSTLLNLIGGLDEVSTGRIGYDDTDIMSNLTHYRADRVGFIFQDYNLISGLSVKKNIELGLTYSYKESKTIDKQIEYFRVKDKNQPVEKLSGGEKQRVAIIRSICRESEIILADEPTGNLDSENSRIVFDILTEIKKGKHIIVVSHDLEMARKYGDRIITMKDGKIIDDRRRFVVEDGGTIYRTIINTPLGRAKHDKDCVTQKNRFINGKAVWMLGVNSIKLSVSKVISIALVIALTMSVLALVFDLNNIGNNISKDVNVNYLETDKISLYYMFDANTAYKEKPFPDSVIEKIRRTYNIREIVPLYMDWEKWGFSYGNSTYTSAIKQITINPFFEERVMSNDIEGEFLNEENDVILAADVASQLFKEPCIGKEITLNSNMGESITLKIVGINHTVNPFDKTYSFVSSMKIKELYEKELAAALSSGLIMLDRLNDEVPSEGGVVKYGKFHGAMKEYQGTEDLLYGRPPQEENEILISSALLPDVLQDLEVRHTASQSDILNGSLPESIISQLASTKLALHYNGLYEVTICGIFLADEYEMKLPKELIHTMQNAIEPTVLEVYLSASANVSDVKDRIEREEEFVAETQLDGLKMNIGQQTTFFRLALLLIGIITIVLSVSMLSSFSKIAVLERNKEVAIIKSLGATNRDVLCTLWFDSVTIFFLAFGLSCLFLGIFSVVFPYVMPEMAFMNYRFPLLPLTLIGLCSLGFICLYTSLGLRKLVRRMPAELLAQ